MTHERATNPNRPSPLDTFRRAMQDASALAAFARAATAVLATRPAASFGRLSQLLDELLPTDDETEARIARALEIEESSLRRLRAGELDPLRAPRSALATLWQALRLERDVFRQLVASDHARFAAQMTPGLATRGSRESDDDAWHALDQAYERLAHDDPDNLDTTVE